MKSKLKTMNNKQVIARVTIHSTLLIFMYYLLSLQIVFMIIKDAILASELL